MRSAPRRHPRRTLLATALACSACASAAHEGRCGAGGSGPECHPLAVPPPPTESDCVGAPGAQDPLAVVLDETARRPAELDPETRARLRDLAHERRDREALGDAPGALALSIRIDRVAPTALSAALIARGQFDVGLYAEAANNAETAIRRTRHDPATPDPARIVAAARDLAERASARLARVIITVDAPLPDGARVYLRSPHARPAAVGVRYVVNPGPVEAVAYVPRDSFSARCLRASATAEAGRSGELHLRP